MPENVGHALVRDCGAPYGQIVKRASDRYVVMRGSTDANSREVCSFVGDFQTRQVQVVDPDGQPIGSSQQTSPEECEVQVQPLGDAGLVILGLLCIDKCEVEPGADASSEGDVGSPSPR